MGTKYQVDGDDLTAIANKIRSKGGTSASLEFPDGFKDAVDAIQTGITPTGTKNINTNGTHDVTNYASANVAVPASAVDTGTKNINSNGTHDVVGYASAAVSVPNSYSQSDEGKVVQSGALVSQSSQTVTENGTYDTTLKNEVVINVSGGGGITTDELALNAKPTGVVTLGSSVTEIKDYAFAGKPITSISGASVTNIGTNSLLNTQITEITDAMFPSLGVSKRYNVLLRIPTLTSITLSGGNISLSTGSYALRDNKALVYARFPHAAQNVGLSYKGCGSYAFGGCTALVLADLGFVNAIQSNAFSGATKISTIILRSTSVVSLANVLAFTNTPFKSGGTGGTIYIPKVLYDQLGTGTNDYESASNWSTVNGYGTITWAKIEGSEFE